MRKVLRVLQGIGIGVSGSLGFLGLLGQRVLDSKFRVGRHLALAPLQVHKAIECKQALNPKLYCNFGKPGGVRGPPSTVRY